MNGKYPDWKTIETPWEPQPIAWRYHDSYTRKKALRTQAATQSTHIVREVLVTKSRRNHTATPLSLSDTSRILDHTNTEHELMRSVGLAVPAVDWHTFDDAGVVRALARVPIIRGVDLKWDEKRTQEDPLYSMICADVQDKTDAYRQSGAEGPRLKDCSGLHQYRYGVPAEDALQQTVKSWLLDIEPLYY